MSKSFLTYISRSNISKPFPNYLSQFGHMKAIYYMSKPFPTYLSNFPQT